MPLRFFREENTDDLDELFDTLARSASEFLRWLQVAADRLPEEERLGFAYGVATALWGFLGNGGFDDEVLEEANDRIAEGMRAQLPPELIGPLNRRRLAGGEYDASSPFNYFGHRAVEESGEREEVKAR